jgi:4-amino-4-deoxy-L-arabinose transferase-like glycosyltransferase
VGAARATDEGDLASRNGGRAGLIALAAILLLGLALRVDYAWEGREPVFDAVAYSRLAANLEAGEGFTVGEAATQPSSNYSPGLPLLVAGLYELCGGEDERLARLILALIGSLAVPFAYLIGRRLSGPGAGLIGAGAVAIYPALLEYQGMLMSEPLAATLLSGAILAMFWAGDAGRPARWLLPGVLLGAVALTRPEYLGVAVLLGLVVLGRGLGDEWRVSLTNAAIMLAGVLLVVAPWTIRNAVALDRFVPISTGGGQVLFAGSYLPSDGDPERVGREVLERHPGLTRRLAAEYAPRVGFSQPPGNNPTQARRTAVNDVLERVRLEQILAALAAQRYPELETDRALARMGRERLWDDLTEQPLAYGGFIATKVWRLWGHGPREVMRRPVWELVHWALVALGALGLVVLVRRRRWEAVPLLTVILAITLISALLVASPRRVLVMLPFLAALAGVGAMTYRDSLARRWNG